MSLAVLLAEHEDIIICDLAEYYHIYNIAELPTLMVARLVCGLRDNSRLKMKLNGQRYTNEELLLAMLYDKAAMLLWTRTEDAARGRNLPESLYEKMTGTFVKKPKKNETFKDLEAFEKRRQEIIERSK